MNRLRRILDGPWWYVLLGFLVCGSILLTSIQAWQGSRFSVAMLTFFGVLWVAIALFNSAGWKRSIQSSRRMLEGWDESNMLIKDFSSLMDESLGELATWNREMAEDIASRWHTVSAMRAQNLRERMESDGR